jgi:hypothetical protein
MQTAGRSARSARVGGLHLLHVHEGPQGRLQFDGGLGHAGHLLVRAHLCLAQQSSHRGLYLAHPQLEDRARQRPLPPSTQLAPPPSARARRRTGCTPWAAPPPPRPPSGAATPHVAAPCARAVLPASSQWAPCSGASLLARPRRAACWSCSTSAPSAHATRRGWPGPRPTAASARPLRLRAGRYGPLWGQSRSRQGWYTTPAVTLSSTTSPVSSPLATPQPTQTRERLRSNFPTRLDISARYLHHLRRRQRLASPSCAR